MAFRMFNEFDRLRNRRGLPNRGPSRGAIPSRPSMTEQLVGGTPPPPAEAPPSTSVLERLGIDEEEAEAITRRWRQSNSQRLREAAREARRTGRLVPEDQPPLVTDELPTFEPESRISENLGLLRRRVRGGVRETVRGAQESAAEFSLRNTPFRRFEIENVGSSIESRAASAASASRFTQAAGNLGRQVATGIGGFAGSQLLSEAGAPDIIAQPIGSGLGAGAVAGGIEALGGGSAAAVLESGVTTGLQAGAGALGGFAGNAVGQGITHGLEDAIGGTSLGAVEDIKRDTAAQDVGAITGGLGAAAVAAATTGIGLPIAALLAAIAGGVIIMNHLVDGNSKLEALKKLRRGDVSGLSDERKDQLYNYYVSQSTNPSKNFDPTTDAAFRQGETIHSMRSMESANLIARNYKKYALGLDSSYHTTDATMMGKIFMDEDYVDPNTGETKLGWYGFQDPEMRNYVKKLTDAYLSKKPEGMKDQDFIAQHEKDIIHSTWTSMGYYDSLLSFDTRELSIGLQQGLSTQQIQDRVRQKFTAEASKFHSTLSLTGNERLLNKIIKQVEHLDKSRAGLDHEKFLSEVYFSPLKSLLAEDGRGLETVTDDQLREFGIRSNINAFSFDVDNESDELPGDGLSILRDSTSGITQSELQQAHMDIDSNLIQETLALSAAAYETVEMFQLWRDWSKCRGFPRKEYIPGFNYSAAVWFKTEVTGDQRLLLSFNGADSKVPLQWDELTRRIHDMGSGMSMSTITNTPNPNVFVNSKLLSIATTMLDTVLPKLLNSMDIRNSPRLVLTGHSLGGSLAILLGTSKRMMCWAFKRGIQKIEIVTYGAPRVGNADFVRVVENMQHVEITRYSNDMDPAVRLPPTYQGYMHAGLERLIHQSGDFTNIFNDGHAEHNHIPNPSSHDGLHLTAHTHGLWTYRFYVSNMIRHFDEMGIDLRALVLPAPLNNSTDEFTAMTHTAITNYGNQFLHKTVFTKSAMEHHTDQLLRFLNVSDDKESDTYKYVKQQLLHRTYTLNHHRNQVLDTHWF